MLRSLFVTSAACLALTACQVEDTPQMSTVEHRLAQSAEVLASCAASECARLDLDSRLVADYASATLPHVTAFMASYSNFGDADMIKIAPMSQLRELHLGNTQLTDISGLSQFPNLTLLHLQWNDVDDLSPIAQLPNLQELALGGNNVGDLSMVRGLPKLTELNLDSATITSFEGLRGHPSLQGLDLINATLPDDLSVLQSIPNLSSISITDWELTEAQMAVIDRLRANGVSVTIEPVIVVC